VIVIPSIDLQGGRTVRLAQGDRARTTVYDADPLATVDAFVAAGVALMHVVDLDGAFSGVSEQLDAIAALIDRAHAGAMQVQVGGGLREAAAVARALDAGADRVVIGTLALHDPELASRLCARHGGRIVIAADAVDGKVAVDGWRERSELSVVELVRDAERWGAAAVLYTDVARDGTQHGPAVDATRTLQAAVEIPVLASGGVGTLADLEACRDAGIRGVIVGRALYERAFTIEEALTRC
jgi:phosphoribosylformimino-5-aminoimidazole carboxamide ribotide isomerase